MVSIVTQSTETFLDTPLLRRAHEFAREGHEGPRRHGDTRVDHPIRVARILHDAGCPEQLVAAGLLHDVLEDTDTDPAELREAFGVEVADLVAGVSENRAIATYERRKAGLRGQAVEAGLDSATLFAADKLASLRALNAAGNTPPRRRLDHYRASVRLLGERAPTVPFLDELESELDELDARVQDQTVMLRDGSTILMRPIEESDAPFLAKAYDRLSEESRRRRFVVAPAHLSMEDLRYLTDVDGTRHDALVAIDPEHGDLVGEARYVREVGRTDTAEVAAFVVDDWQNRGIATALLTELSRRASGRGLIRYKAIVGADNRVVLDALEKLGGDPVDAGDGQVELVFDLPADGFSERLAGALRSAAGGQFRLLGEIARRAARLTGT
jgi:GNAT superfamily N-acetyltransferase